MTVLVDSSVWTDWFADCDTLQTRALRTITVRQGRLAVGDLVLAEGLEGTRGQRDDLKLMRLSLFDPVTMVDRDAAVQAARNYRQLRALGIPIRKTIDTLIATRCFLDGMPLLYSDRDYDPFVAHLGLRSALDDTGDRHA